MVLQKDFVDFQHQELEVPKQILGKHIISLPKSDEAIVLEVERQGEEDKQQDQFQVVLLQPPGLTTHLHLVHLTFRGLVLLQEQRVYFESSCGID